MKRRIVSVRPSRDVKTISDTNKLLWERYWGPMNAAAQQLNAAILNAQNVVARIIIEREELNPDTHLLEVDRMVILERPTGP